MCYPRIAAVLLAATLAALVPATAQERPDLPFGYKHLIAAYTFRSVAPGGAPNEFVVLGRYDFVDERNCLFTYFYYDARKNARPSETPVRHPRVLPDAPGVPGPFRIPAYDLFDTIRGTWVVTGDGTLRIRFGNVVHDWARKDADGLFMPPHPYVNARDGSHTMDGGTTFLSMHGYAYLSDYANVPHRLTRDDLLPDYSGEILTLVHQRGGPSQWVAKQSDLHQQRYQAFTAGDLMILSHHTVSNRTNPPSVSFSNLMLNYAPHSRLLVYTEGGHDFNRNGVFDELGHTMQMYGIYDGRRVSKFVFVEYSYQTAGYPILTVGRYYGPGAVARPPAVAPEFEPLPLPRTAPPSDDGFIPPLPTLRPR